MNPIESEIFDSIVSNFFEHPSIFKDTDEVYVEPVPESEDKGWDCW
jgi:hypothetical protein